MIFLCAALISISGCAKKLPSAAPALSQQEMKKIVVARVNGVDLFMDALNRMVNIMSANTPTTSSPAPGEDLRKKALDQLVLRELAFQEAKRQDLIVDARDVSRAMDNFIRGLGHEAGFQSYLEREKTTEPEVRAQVEKSLLLQLLFNKEVVKKANVPEDDMRAYYEGRKQEFLTAEKQMSFEEAKGLIEKKLKPLAQSKRIDEWEQELKKGAVIELLDLPATEGQKKP
jgi:hypothetical protein